ncbi:hypothetical protein [Halorubrum saccharovorum]|uniref:hypothetical protein n=1 Tax=Halorubrum saccharovorum TaxID=2248 RepID=UPI001269655B|nr:hypothetical protein [Halorubrum saccharovorum]
MDYDSSNPGGPDLDTSALHEEYNNAKERLNQQRNVLTAFAKEARQTLRIILVLAGLLVSSITVYSTRTGTDNCSVYVIPDYCLSQFGILTLSGLALAISAICNGMIGTEARAIGSIGTVTDIEGVLTGDTKSEQDYLRERLRRYRDRIERNNGVIQSLETLLAIGKLNIFVGILGLTTAGIATITDPIEWYVTFLGLAISGLFFLILGRAMPDEYIKRDSAVDGDSYLRSLLLTEKDAEDKE